MPRISLGTEKKGIFVIFTRYLNFLSERYRVIWLSCTEPAIAETARTAATNVEDGTSTEKKWKHVQCRQQRPILPQVVAHEEAVVRDRHALILEYLLRGSSEEVWYSSCFQVSLTLKNSAFVTTLVQQHDTTITFI